MAVAIAASEELVDLTGEGFDADMRLTPPFASSSVVAPLNLHAAVGPRDRKICATTHAYACDDPAVHQPFGRSKRRGGGRIASTDRQRLSRAPGAATEGTGLAQAPKTIAAEP